MTHLQICEVRLLFCGLHNITLQDLKGPSRKREITDARHQFLYFLREKTKLSLKKIGDYVGGKDHSTVIKSKKTHLELCETDKSYRQLYKDCVCEIYIKFPELKTPPREEITPEQIAKRIEEVKSILYSPEVIDSENFRPYKEELNTLLELQECQARKQLIGNAENTLKNSKLV